jgi:hypothetical protein
MPGRVPICKKSSTMVLRISKKDGVASWQFKKKIGSAAENSGKRAGHELKISKNDRIASRQFLKKDRPACYGLP